MTISPFRYPGGKTKLLPALMEQLSEFISNPEGTFADVFVGGGSVLLEVARQYPQINLYANDKDYWVYCFWKVVADSDSKKLEELLRLMEAKPTLELFYKLREENTKDEIRCAYKAIFFNRTTFSGIFYSGPIGGKEQKSKYTIDCRYNYKKLKNKILECHHLLTGRTSVSNQDCLDFCRDHLHDCTLYLDPPYYHKGDILYIEKMSSNEHTKLAEFLDKAEKNWVLSYDDCVEVRELYKNQNIIDLPARYCITGKKETWEHKGELIILPRQDKA